MLSTTSSEIILAAGGGSAGANTFLSSPLGEVVVMLCGGLGILIALFGIFKAIGAFIKGRIGEGFKVILVTLFLGALLFNLNLTIDAISWLSGIVGDGVASLKNFS